MRFVLLEVLLIVQLLRCAARDPHPNGANYRVGDPRNCKLAQSTHGMEVLPGIGWDNLENLDKSQILATNYSLCRTTADGEYLIPDHVFVIPIKRSKVELFSQMFEHWSRYQSSTARSINMGVQAYSVVSGSFSTEFQYNKEKQVNDNSFTTRVSVRHHLYTIKSNPDAPLSRSFLNHVMEIASNIQNNRTRMAWYNAQLLVRKFGTHLTTSVDAGAALTKEDHLKSSFLKDASLSTSAVKATARLTFFSKIGFNFGISHKEGQGHLKQYMGNLTSSHILTYGGPAFAPNFTVNTWAKGTPNELVPINREGELLHYVINTITLPGLPPPTISHVAKLVEKAVSLYYKVNTIPGCTDSASENFYFDANVDDGSCQQPSINFTFGGVFQKCYSLRSGAGNLCDKLEQKNPLTGDFSCPEGYEEVLLIRPGGRRPRISKSYHKTNCIDICRGCGFLWLNRCCNKICMHSMHHSLAEYDTYWCAAKKNVHPSSGYLYGGAFSTNSPNPLTGSQECPHRFYPRALGGHSYVCISDDFELGYQFSLKFAGFFSCSAGNPLAIGIKNDSSLVRSSSQLENFLASDRNGEAFYGPKRCPHGYSQHLVTVDNECEINYCIKANSFRDQKLQSVKRMPFSPKPGDNPNATDAVLIVGVNGQVWYKNVTTGDWDREPFSATKSPIPEHSHDSKGSISKNLSNGATAAISVGVTTCVCLFVAVAYLAVKRRQQAKAQERNGLFSSHNDPERNPLTPPED